MASAGDSLEISPVDGEWPYVNFALALDGALEIEVDQTTQDTAGGYHDAEIRIAPEDVPEALVAIQTWIESLSAGRP
jgi:hypothetical protein